MVHETSTQRFCWKCRLAPAVFPKPRVEHTAECNRVIRMVQRHEVNLVLEHIGPKILVFLLSADSGLANIESLRSQPRWAVCALDR